ncbi:MAG: Efflux transporter, RND family, MFP subunit [Candidatus Curtissbacteria bacterium GW2011_GWA1_40_47]|nr:MAG: Efflux transporter, RND family, MFP subunit [Microgenomates group bacterium GW2011_GWC1_40_35]KKR65455.1 MAG: Efflux transporter, RND family, MFP subunit [Candidatus Curtissbacteria bacterium GW2011_GWA1_40_47]KKS02005.1 MAG: Efflux transporter, RND family, MFP subunit [Candidatus Curtissbacteria bacterium GW2011_GWC2_41_21]
MVFEIIPPDARNARNGIELKETQNMPKTKINDPSIYQKIPKILRSKKVLLALAIVIIFAFIGTRGGADMGKIKTAQVEQKNIASEIVTAGKISSQSESTIHPAVNGKVVWVPVKEGDFVKKGQAIASLDKEKYEIALRQTEQDVVALDAELEKLYDGRRNKTSIESYDEKIERTALEAAKNKAYDEWLEAKRNLKDTVITSPFAGTVIEVNVHPGEEIFYTTAIAKIADIENLNFTAELDDTDVGQIKEGQKTIVTLDAFPDEEILSQVESVSFVSNVTSSGSDVFEVKFNLEQEEDYRIGMNGESRIIIQEKEDVLAVSVEAIFDENFVHVKTNGEFVKREVEKGIESDSEVEIVSGLSKDETVVIAGLEEIGKKTHFFKILSIFVK